MKLARAGACFVIVSLLHACGGGGSNGGSNEPPPPPPGEARLTVSPTNVSASATPGQAAPTGSITLSIANPPTAGIFLSGTFTAAGIESVTFEQTNAFSGQVTIGFYSPNGLQNDVYADAVTLHACTDSQCNSEIDGSPVTVQTAYTVSGTGIATASLDRPVVEVSAAINELNYRSEPARITLSVPAAAPIHVERSFTANALQEVNWIGDNGQTTDLDIQFLATNGLGPGRFTDTITLRLCYDNSCIREVAGSPLTVSTVLSVNAVPEAGVPELEVASRMALPHDVIDAEFDRAHNRIVMVGSEPADAIYVYEVATGDERSQPLVKAASAVSVSPDGLTAAVGHDALISIIDIAGIGDAGAPPATLVNVPVPVSDLVLDARGRVHAVEGILTWTSIHSVDIASNTFEYGTGASVSGGSTMRLHPSGDFLYLADEYNSGGDDIYKWDISGAAATYVHDSPYFGEHAMCGNLWFNDAGDRIYTACGSTFQSSSTLAQDMVYVGSLALTQIDRSPFMIRSASIDAARNEVALLEYDWSACRFTGYPRSCYSNLAFAEADFLRRLGVYALAPIRIGETDYTQFGLFVFHDAASARKYVISRALDAPDPAAAYYLSVIE